MAKNSKSFAEMGSRYDEKLTAALEKARLVYEDKKRKIYLKFQSDFAKKYAKINPIQQAPEVEKSEASEVETTESVEKTDAEKEWTYEPTYD